MVCYGRNTPCYAFSVSPIAGAERTSLVADLRSGTGDAEFTELNERFGTTFAKADQLFFDQSIETAKTDEEVASWAKANSFDNFSLAARQKMLGAVADRLDANEEIVTRLMNDASFQDVALKEMLRRVYEEVRRGA